MSHPIDLAFPGEPDYRDSLLLDAIQQGQSATHQRLRDSSSVARPVTRHCCRPPRTPFPRSPEGDRRRYRTPSAGPGVWG